MNNSKVALLLISGVTVAMCPTAALAADILPLERRACCHPRRSLQGGFLWKPFFFVHGWQRFCCWTLQLHSEAHE